jgi:hypothetical protein
LSDVPLEQLRVFLRDHVSSFEQLQALLCLAREPRARSPAEVSAATGVPLEQTENALDELSRGQKLVSVSAEGRRRLYAYAPAASSTPALVSQLARAYDEQLLTIVRMMSDNAVERVRSTAARRLAEAFRLDRERK